MMIQEIELSNGTGETMIAEAYGKEVPMKLKASSSRTKIVLAKKYCQNRDTSQKLSHLVLCEPTMTTTNTIISTTADTGNFTEYIDT